jgi:predicted RNA binding protein YcfA (HicA-like mRNA interferase family)
MKSGALMKLIKEEGWQLVRIRGATTIINTLVEAVW